MGLDNGILLIAEKSKRLDRMFSDETNIFDDDPALKDFIDGKAIYEVCYWRNYWYMRNSFVYTCNAAYDETTAMIGMNELKLLKDIVNSFIVSNEYASRYWDKWAERKVLIRNQRRLLKLIRYVKRHPEAKVAWYDSY